MAVENPTTPRYQGVRVRCIRSDVFADLEAEINAFLEEKRYCPSVRWNTVAHNGSVWHYVMIEYYPETVFEDEGVSIA